MRKTFAELSKNEIANNPNSFVILGDIGIGSFLNSEDNLPDRVLNTGIAEQAMIGFAAGLSTGKGNVIVHTIAAFLIERAFEQIKLCCGYNECKLILVSANGPYDYEKLGPTHHSPSDVTLLMTVPNLNIRIPATDEDLRECYADALASQTSTYIRCTSREAKLEKNPTVVNNKWKKIVNEDTSKVVVCIGEGLTYALGSFADSSIYWTTDPTSTLPEELNCYKEIIILEPYTGSFIQIPESFTHKSITRRNFKTENKKIMKQNLGWEDFIL